MSNDHSQSMMDISTTNITQFSKKKRKALFEEELRSYEPKDNKSSVSFDPMVEKLKQWKKERELKQINRMNKSEGKPKRDTSKLLQKRSFENSLRSYNKPQQNKINQRRNRLKSSLRSFYERFNSNKISNSSHLFPTSMNRSQILSSSTSKIHKQGFFSENNSICPSLDRNNIDFIDQIEDRIEDLYYDFMDQNITDRQQMRKEIIQILHMCDIKIIKGLMVGGIEQIKLNQQLWYIFLLNFDFKLQWKENSLKYIKVNDNITIFNNKQENNIMQDAHLEFAEQNINIIPDQQNKSEKSDNNELNSIFYRQELNEEQNDFKQQNMIENTEFLEYDIQNKEELNNQQNEDDQQFQLEIIKEDVIDENIKDFNKIQNSSVLSKIEQQDTIQNNFTNKLVNADNQFNDFGKEQKNLDSLFISNNRNIPNIMIVEYQQDINNNHQNSINDRHMDIQDNIESTNNKQSQNMQQRFEWLSAEIANPNQKEINIKQNQQHYQSEQMQEVQQTEESVEISNQTPQLAIQNTTPDSRLKSITRRLNYNLNIDAQEQLLQFSPWKEMKQAEDTNTNNTNLNNIQSQLSIFVPLTKKENENISEIIQQKQRNQKFSFGNTFQITSEQMNSRIKIKESEDHKHDKQKNTQQEIQQKQQQQVQKQLFNNNLNLNSEIMEEEYQFNNDQNIIQQQNSQMEQSQLQNNNENIKLNNNKDVKQINTIEEQQIDKIQKQQDYENKSIFNIQFIVNKINEIDQQKKQSILKQQNINEKQQIASMNQSGDEKENNSSKIDIQNQKVNDIFSKQNSNNVNIQSDKINMLNYSQSQKFDQLQSQKNKVNTNLFFDKLLKINSITNDEKKQNNKENDYTINNNQNKYQLYKNLDNQQLSKKKQQQQNIKMNNNQQDKLTKQEFIKQIQFEDLNNSENHIKKRIKNENGQYQNVLYQIQNNNQNIPNNYYVNKQNQQSEIQSQVQQKSSHDTIAIENNEYSFNFNNFNQIKNVTQETNIFQVQFDQLQQDKNSQNTCDFSVISNTLPNIKNNNNNIFERNVQKDQRGIQFQQNQKQPITSIPDKDINQQLNIQINTITNLSFSPFSQPHQNLDQIQNQIINNTFFKQNLDIQIELNKENQIINQSFIFNQNQSTKQEQQLEQNIQSPLQYVQNEQSEKKQKTQSKKKRNYQVSPSQMFSQKLNDSQQSLTFNDLLNLSKSKSKRKSILGLDINEIQNEVIDDTGSQYVKSIMIAQTSVKKKYQEDEEDNNVQWVRRSLRISQKKSNQKCKDKLISSKKRNKNNQRNEQEQDIDQQNFPTNHSSQIQNTSNNL